MTLVLANFKVPRDDSEAYLANLRQLPCVVCGNPAPNTVHHLKATGRRGIGLKSPDRYGLPMCWFPAGEHCHNQIEAIGSKHELEWLAERGIEALDLCDRLWTVRNSLAAMRLVLWESLYDGK